MMHDWWVHALPKAWYDDNDGGWSTSGLLYNFDRAGNHPTNLAPFNSHAPKCLSSYCVQQLNKTSNMHHCTKKGPNQSVHDSMLQQLSLPPKLWGCQMLRSLKMELIGETMSCACCFLNYCTVIRIPPSSSIQSTVPSGLAYSGSRLLFSHRWIRVVTTTPCHLPPLGTWWSPW
jgi:hypothetical protein